MISGYAVQLSILGAPGRQGLLTQETWWHKMVSFFQKLLENKSPLHEEKALTSSWFQSTATDAFDKFHIVLQV